MAKSAEAFRTISEVSEILETPAHVLRFWESQFSQVRPLKRAGGRRYYRPQDVALLGGIRKLLHDDGITIRGVQKILREQGARQVAAISGLSEDGALVAEVVAPAGAALESPPVAAPQGDVMDQPAPKPETTDVPEAAKAPVAPPPAAPAATPSPSAAEPDTGGDREPFLPFLPMPEPREPAPEAPMVVDAPTLPRTAPAPVIPMSGVSGSEDPAAVRLRHADIVRAGARRDALAAVYARLRTLRERRRGPVPSGPSGAQD